MKAVTQRLTASLTNTTLNLPRPFADLELPLSTQKALQKELSQQVLKPAAVLVGIHQGLNSTSIILTRRSEELRNHPGQISFPGGSKDPADNSLQETALRESYEEINLPVEMVEIIGYLPDYPTITGYCVTPIVGLIEEPASRIMQPDGIEATELIHLPLEFALDQTSYERKLIERNGLSVPIYHLAYEGFDIWGATAGMLYQLCLHFNRYENTA